MGTRCTWWPRRSNRWKPRRRWSARPGCRRTSSATRWKASRAKSARCRRHWRARRRGEPFARPCVILSGGETTVTVRKQPEGTPRGRGGRAGEFCLGLAQALQGQTGVWALAADTDGIDGVEDNAGAFVAPDTLERALAQGMKIDTFLGRNDAYGYFSALGDLVVTGPTHTNVNDFRALLVL